MERPWESGKAPPVALILGALCKTLDAIFLLTASEVFIKYSTGTQDFLRRIRVKP